jgi:stage V sporulation protein B
VGYLGGNVIEGEQGLEIGLGRTSAKGSFNMFWGLALSTAISSVSLVLLGILLPTDEFGIIAVVFYAPQFITIFTDWGINSAVIKYAAQYRAEQKTTNLKRLLIVGVVFQVGLGVLFAVLCFVLSGFFAVDVLQRPAVQPLIQISSITIFAGVLVTASQSVFIGYERMDLYSIVQVVQASVKGILSSILVIVGFGALGAIVGTSIAFGFSGAVAVAVFYFSIYRFLPKGRPEEIKINGMIKMMLKYGLPLSVSAILSGFLLQFYNLLIGAYSSNASIGNYNIALNFTVFIAFFVTPISTVLFPTFSKIGPQSDPDTVRRTFHFSVKYAALFVAPVAAALVALAEPAVFTVFGQKYLEAPLYLSLSVLVLYVYSVFGSLSVDSLLNGFGKTYVTLALTLISLAVGLPLALLLIPSFGVVGMLLTSFAAGSPTVTVGLWWIKTRCNLCVDWASSLKILLSSAAAAAVTCLVVFLLVLPSFLELAIGALLYLAVYLVVTPLIGAISKSDIRILRQMLSGLTLVSKLLSPPLGLMEKLAWKTE